jgi:hypothetical protein
MGTSRARRRRLHVVEPIPNRRHASPPDQRQRPSTEEPAEAGEAPQPNGAPGQADLDAISTGMVVMLRAALRLMRSCGNASPVRRDRRRS